MNVPIGHCDQSSSRPQSIVVNMMLTQGDIAKKTSLIKLKKSSARKMRDHSMKWTTRNGLELDNQH